MKKDLSLRILAFDTSSFEFSFSLVEDENTVFSNFDKDTGDAEGSRKGSSSQLIPSIRAGLDAAGWKLKDLGLIVLTIGPGSFTGLRVGVVTAKTLSYVNQTPLVSVNVLHVLGAQAANWVGPDHFDGQIHSVVNAQRQQLFAAEFKVENRTLCLKNHSPANEVSTRIMERPDWIDSLQSGDVVTGSGLTPLLDELSKRDGVRVTPSELWRVDATELARIGLARFENGHQDDMWKLVPEYFRPSWAEEKAKLGDVK